MASTKCCWNIGSTAVFDLLDDPADHGSTSSRASLLSSAMRAPVPGGIARPLCTRVEIAIRDEAQDHRVFHVDGCESRRHRPGGSCRRFVDIQLVHQQAHAGIKRGLGHLNGAHVILGDADQRLVRFIRRLTNDIVEGALVGFDRGGDCAASEPSIKPILA